MKKLISILLVMIIAMASVFALAEGNSSSTVKEQERPSYNGKPLAIGGLPDDVIVSIVDTLTEYVPTMKDLFVNPYSVEIKEAKYLFDGDFWFKFLCTNKMGGTVVEELLLYETDSGWVLDGSAYMISTKLNMMTFAQREFSKNDIAWVNSLL